MLDLNPFIPQTMPVKLGTKTFQFPPLLWGKQIRLREALTGMELAADDEAADKLSLGLIEIIAPEGQAAEILELLSHSAFDALLGKLIDWSNGVKPAAKGKKKIRKR